MKVGGTSPSQKKRVSKAAFIRDNLSKKPKDVVALAKAEGLEMTAAYVSSQQSKAKTKVKKGRRGKKFAAKQHAADRGSVSGHTQTDWHGACEGAAGKVRKTNEWSPQLGIDARYAACSKVPEGHVQPAIRPAD